MESKPFKPIYVIAAIAAFILLELSVYKLVIFNPAHLALPLLVAFGPLLVVLILVFGEE